MPLRSAFTHENLTNALQWRTATMTDDYKRNGTTTCLLFAVLNTWSGEVMGMCMQRHREWLRFPWHIQHKTPPAKQVQITCNKLRDA